MGRMRLFGTRLVLWLSLSIMLFLTSPAPFSLQFGRLPCEMKAVAEAPALPLATAPPALPLRPAISVADADGDSGGSPSSTAAAALPLPASTAFASRKAGLRVCYTCGQLCDAICVR